MAKDLTLARRVQLAALAYIRHTKTRYDALLKETDWANARKAVEKPCLDIIVKWRGDEETGRDQLDEILREVIEISDSEDDSEEEESSSESAASRSTSQSVRGVSTAPAASLAPLRLVPIMSGPITAQGRRHTPVQRLPPLTPVRQKGMTRIEKRTARKAAQRFRRYAAVAESIAHENGQNGHNGRDQTPRLPATVDLTDSPASHHPGRSTREPQSVAYRVLSPGRPNRAHLGQELASIDASLAGDPGWPVHPAGNRRYPASPEFPVPESQRPKVGALSPVQHGPTQTTMSPITNGLQDLLVPSVEPLSPNVPEHGRYSSRTLHREYQGVVNAPSTTTYTVPPPGSYIVRPRSPPSGFVGDERSAKRSRITTYFPEDYDVPSGSRFAPLDYAKAGENSRFVPIGYPSTRSNVLRRVESQRFEQPIAISSPGYAPHAPEDIPARPIDPNVVGSDISYRPQRMVEVHGHSARGRLDAADISRPREVVYEHALGSRAQPEDRLYHDERITLNHQQNSGPHSFTGGPRQEDSAWPLSSDASRSISQARPNYPSYQPVRYREVPQSDHYVHRPIEHAGYVPRETHTASQKLSHFEM